MRALAKQKMIDLLRYQLKQKRYALSVKQHDIRSIEGDMETMRTQWSLEKKVLKTLPVPISGERFFVKMEDDRLKLQERVRSLQSELAPLMEDIRNLFRQVKAHEISHMRGCTEALADAMRTEEKRLEDVRSALRHTPFRR